MIEHRKAGAALERGIRIAIERVLADIEIERRKIDRHEGVERGEDALEVEIAVSAANQRIELGQPVQHQALELRHVRQRHALVAVQMREIAQHPAQRVAQLAVGLDGRFQDFRADALVVPIVGRARPQPQDIGARLLDHILRRHRVAERLRHFAAVLVEREAVSDHDVERRLAARAAGFRAATTGTSRGAGRSLRDTSPSRRRRRACGGCRRAPESVWGLRERRRALSRNRTRRREYRRLSASPGWRACRESVRARPAGTRHRRPLPRRHR